MNQPGTIHMKLNLDTSEAAEKLKALIEDAWELRRLHDDIGAAAWARAHRDAINRATLTGPSVIALSIDERLRGVSLSEQDADYLIEQIRMRTIRYA